MSDNDLLSNKEARKNIADSIAANFLDAAKGPEDGFLLRYAAVVDWVESDGNRKLWQIASDGHGGLIMDWEVNGMIGFMVKK